MPTFCFEGMDSSGSEVRDQIDAANEVDAQRQLQARGYFVTKISEITNNRIETRPSASSVPESVTISKNGAEDGPTSVEETAPGSRIQCHVISEQLILEIAPGPIVLSPNSLGCLVPFFALLVYLTLGFTAQELKKEFREGYAWIFTAITPVTFCFLIVCYVWRRDRSTTHVLIEPGRLVTRFELFGRQKTQEYVLGKDDRASLVADYRLGGSKTSGGIPVYHVHVTTNFPPATFWDNSFFSGDLSRAVANAIGRPVKFGISLSLEEKQWIVARINRHLGHPTPTPPTRGD